MFMFFGNMFMFFGNMFMISENIFMFLLDYRDVFCALVKHTSKDLFISWIFTNIVLTKTQ